MEIKVEKRMLRKEPGGKLVVDVSFREEERKRTRDGVDMKSPILSKKRKCRSSKVVDVEVTIDPKTFSKTVTSFVSEWLNPDDLLSIRATCRSAREVMDKSFPLVANLDVSYRGSLVRCCPFDGRRLWVGSESKPRYKIVVRGGKESAKECSDSTALVEVLSILSTVDRDVVEQLEFVNVDFWLVKSSDHSIRGKGVFDVVSTKGCIGTDVAFDAVVWRCRVANVYQYSQPITPALVDAITRAKPDVIVAEGSFRLSAVEKLAEYAKTDDKISVRTRIRSLVSSAEVNQHPESSTKTEDERPEK